MSTLLVHKRFAFTAKDALVVDSLETLDAAVDHMVKLLAGTTEARTVFIKDIDMLWDSLDEAARDSLLWLVGSHPRLFATAQSGLVNTELYSAFRKIQ